MNEIEIQRKTTGQENDKHRQTLQTLLASVKLGPQPPPPPRNLCLVMNSAPSKAGDDCPDCNGTLSEDIQGHTFCTRCRTGCD